MITAIEWLKANWKGLGYPLAAVFALLWWNKGCPEPVAATVVTATQSQAVTQTAKASIQVKLVYRDRIVEVPGEAPRSLPSPCPDVIVDADASENQTHWQSQAVTSTPKSLQDAPRNVLFAGLGYLEGPTASAGYGYGPWRASAQAGFGRIGGGLTLDVIKW